MPIDIKELVESISTLDKKLFEELLGEQLALNKAFYRMDYEKVLIKTGKFVETAFQILEKLHKGSYSSQPDLIHIKESLEQTPSSRYPDSIRILIPRLAKAVYDFRSRRGGAHKSEINPQYIDATICLTTVNWIVAEFVRSYSKKRPQKVESLIKQTVTRSLPFVEEFEDGDIMLLIDLNSCKEECLLVLYHFYPERISNKRMKEYLDHQSNELVLTSLNNAEEERLVHRNENGNKLTLKGRAYVEKHYGPKLTLENE